MSLLLLFQPFTPAIVNNANTTVNYEGNDLYSIEKTGGTNGAWDASGVSSASITGLSRVRARHISGTLTVGMHVNPTADNSIGGYAEIYMDGSTIIAWWFAGNMASVSTSNKYAWLVRDTVADTFAWYHNNVDDFSSATLLHSMGGLGTGSTWYLDSSLNTAGAKVEVEFEAYTPPVNTTLTADVGSYSLTGTAVQFIPARKLVAVPGAYAITGTAAVPRAGRRLAATPGSYALTGTATGLRKGFKTAAAVGAYVLTGTATALKAARTLVGAVGSYLLTGTAVGLHAARKTTADAGSYALGGQDVTLSYGAGAAVLAADVGNYTLSGGAALLGASRRLTGDIGGYTYTGLAVGLARTRQLLVASGAYALSGSGVTLRVGRRIVIAVGKYRLTGFPVVLTYTSIWATPDPLSADYVNDNPDEATWTIIDPAEPAFAASDEPIGTWTVQEPTAANWA